MRIADVLPLTPLQQGLLFHAAAQASDDLYAVQLDITVTGPLDPHRLREAVQVVVNRHPAPGGPIQRESSTSRCRSSRPIPRRRWQYVDLDADDDVDSRGARPAAVRG